MTVLTARAGASPLLVGAARLWVAAVLLSLAARTTVRVAAPRDLRRCVLMGACMAGYQAAYFTAVTLSGITMTALIAICSAPLMIAALAPAALGERLTPRVRFALGLGVAGTALLVAAPQGMLELTARLVAGALLALAAGLAYAIYVVLAKATLARLAPLPLTALRSEEHTSELQSPCNLVCRLLLEKKKKNTSTLCTGRHSNDARICQACGAPSSRPSRP